MLVPLGPDDPLISVTDLASLSGRFPGHEGSLLLLTMSLIASPPLFTCCHMEPGSGRGSGSEGHEEGNAGETRARAHIDINEWTHCYQLL